MLHRRIIFRLLLSKFCSWHQAFFNFMKTTQRSVNSGQFSSSSFCLTNEDGQTKYKFFTWNTSILIQAMNQDIILSCKQLHRWKQLEESCNFERKWEWRGKKIKRQFPRLKSTKYEYKKEPVCHLSGLEDRYYREILEKGAELETKLGKWQGMVKLKW